MLQYDYAAIMADQSKRIDGDISWEASRDGLDSMEFRMDVAAQGSQPLFVHGRYNSRTRKLSFALICPDEGVGRIYGLDFGMTHRNPDGSRAGDPHKNYWTEGGKDSWGYTPTDITASWDDPVRAWAEFCAEARIRFSGIMRPPWETRLEHGR